MLERGDTWISTECPYCGAKHDVAGAIQSEHDTPKDGSASVCADCGEFSLFEASAKGGLRVFTTEEWEQFCAEVDVPKIRALWHIAKSAHELMKKAEGTLQ